MLSAILVEAEILGAITGHEKLLQKKKKKKNMNKIEIFIGKEHSARFKRVFNNVSPNCRTRSYVLSIANEMQNKWAICRHLKKYNAHF